MSPDRLRSIVPMFGGGTHYVETLDAILHFVERHQPTTDELVEWHRTTFTNVSSRDSIMRRIRYLADVGFLKRERSQWLLGAAGNEYLQNQTTRTLLRIMCSRNVGLRSLMYVLATGPMTIEEISDQQLDTHPELGWRRGATDMAKQRANWLRSMGLVEKRGTDYALTADGRQFVDEAVAAWTDLAWGPGDAADGVTAETHETTAQARGIDSEFREIVLSRYDRTCPVSGIDHPGLLDVAHVLSWSEHPNHRADLRNVLPLSKTHHAAFDRGLFTIDQDYRLRMNPSFDTQSDVLQRTLVDRAGERLSLSDGSVDSEYLSQHNAALDWV